LASPRTSVLTIRFVDHAAFAASLIFKANLSSGSNSTNGGQLLIAARMMKVIFPRAFGLVSAVSIID
jgi:hypothetical protein